MHPEELALRPEPQWGDLSFLSVDPVVVPSDPQSANAYTYARNNPISNTDPTGAAWVTSCGAGCTSYHFTAQSFYSSQSDTSFGNITYDYNDGSTVTRDVTGSDLAGLSNSQLGNLGAANGQTFTNLGGQFLSGVDAAGSQAGGTQHADNATDAGTAQPTDFNRAVNTAANNAHNETARLKVDTGSYVMKGPATWGERLTGVTQGETNIGDYRVTRATPPIARGGNIGSPWNATSTAPRNVSALVIAPYAANGPFLQTRINANSAFYGNLANQFNAPVVVLGPLGARITFSPGGR